MVAANKDRTSVRDPRLLAASICIAYAHVGLVVKVAYGGSAQDLVARSECLATPKQSTIRMVL